MFTPWLFLPRHHVLPPKVTRSEAAPGKLSLSLENNGKLNRLYKQRGRNNAISPAYPTPMILFVSVHFRPRLLEDVGHGPLLDDTLQISVIIKRKKNEKMRAQEPKGAGLGGRSLY